MLKQNIFEFRENVAICNKTLIFLNIRTCNRFITPCVSLCDYTVSLR